MLETSLLSHFESYSLYLTFPYLKNRQGEEIPNSHDSITQATDFLNSEVAAKDKKPLVSNQNNCGTKANFFC